MLAQHQAQDYSPHTWNKCRSNVLCYWAGILTKLCTISGLRRGVDEVFVLLRCYVE